MKSTFQRFVPMTPVEQRKLHATRLRRQLSRRLLVLAESNRPAIERAEKLEARATAISPRIARVEDRVANRADKTYGGWKTWRSNRAKLAAVCACIAKASAPLRRRRDLLLEQARRLRAPYAAGSKRLRAQLAAALSVR